jgi:hypothetical protein
MTSTAAKKAMNAAIPGSAFGEPSAGCCGGDDPRATSRRPLTLGSEALDWRRLGAGSVARESPRRLPEL